MIKLFNLIHRSFDGILIVSMVIAACCLAMTFYASYYVP